jgi:F-type H+-transporting ATPase subunit epsilon
MPGPLTLELCSPEFSPVSHDAESAVIPGEAGVFTVLPGHTPLLTTLRSGVLIVRGRGTVSHFYAVHGGFAEVFEDRIRILADLVEPADKIDRAAAQAELEKAMRGMRTPGVYAGVAAAERSLLMSRARLQAADRAEY